MVSSRHTWRCRRFGNAVHLSDCEFGSNFACTHSGIRYFQAEHLYVDYCNGALFLDRLRDDSQIYGSPDQGGDIYRGCQGAGCKALQDHI